MNMPISNLTKFLSLFGLASLILFLLVWPAWGQSGGDFEIIKSVMVGSGGESSGGDFELQGTAGQPAVGDVSGSGYTLASGFWTPDCAAPTVTASLNGGVQFTWPGGALFDFYRMVDEPYANDGTQIGFGESSGWIYVETVLGDPAQNAYYLVGAADGCGERVGAFDFGIVPGN